MIAGVELNYNSNALAMQVASTAFEDGDLLQVFWLGHATLPTLKRFMPLKLSCLHIRLLGDLVTTQNQRLNTCSEKNA
jgi:sulfur relay (sulfurtransferase) complex TusBCD TusD component (DsrE family)